LLLVRNNGFENDFSKVNHLIAQVDARFSNPIIEGVNIFW